MMRFLLLLTFIAPAVLSIDIEPSCSNCKKKCKWYDLVCKGERSACKAVAAPFQAFTAGVEAACNNDSIRMDGRELIQEAKDILVCNGLYTKEEVDRPQYRFCNAIGVWGANTGGMAPARDKVIFHGDWRYKSANELAALMAHELVHIKQYSRWGSEGFACRYQKELVKNNGYGKSNAVEKEAYDFASIASECIFHGSGCPKVCNRRLQKEPPMEKPSKKLPPPKAEEPKRSPRYLRKE